MTLGSLFTGAGGMDLGFEQAGFAIRWQCEVNRGCLRFLARKWPNVPRFGDIRGFLAYELEPVDVVCGGDPCPVRSRARGGRPAAHPDLSGYFLAVVGRLRPRWVVRENVPAPDIACFDAAMAALGYRTLVVELDAAAFTGQSRKRDFLVGCREAAGLRRAEVLLERESLRLAGTAKGHEEGEVFPCLTTNRTRYDPRDCYIWEARGALRVLDGDERDALAGFPPGWTAGLSEGARARLTGNAVAVPCARWIADVIRQVEREGRAA